MGKRILINTDKMEFYADRLRALNRRLYRLDHQMDRLYLTLGVLEIGKLYRADSFVSYSRTIHKCADYCDDTAKLFENAERKIAKKEPLTYQGFPSKEEIRLFLNKVVSHKLTKEDIVLTIARYAGIDEGNWYVELLASEEPVQTVIELANLEDTAWGRIITATDDYIGEFLEWYKGGPLVLVTGTVDLLFDTLDFVFIPFREGYVQLYMTACNVDEETARAVADETFTMPSKYAREEFLDIPVVDKCVETLVADYQYVYETAKYTESTLDFSEKVTSGEIFDGDVDKTINSYIEESQSYFKNTDDYYAYKSGQTDSFTWKEYKLSDDETISLLNWKENGKHTLHSSGGGGGGSRSSSGYENGKSGGR